MIKLGLVKLGVLERAKGSTEGGTGTTGGELEALEGRKGGNWANWEHWKNWEWKLVKLGAIPGSTGSR